MKAPKFNNEYITYKGLSIEKHFNGYFVKGFNPVGLHIYESVDTFVQAKKLVNTFNKKTLKDKGNELFRYGIIKEDNRTETDRKLTIYSDRQYWFIHMIKGEFLKVCKI